MKAAYAFSLPDQDGKVHSLREYLGKWVLLYFYPKDNTPGCTTEACSFRDDMQVLHDLGVVILGISKDTVQSHKGFATKHRLNFPILSDPQATVITAYGAYKEKSMFGKTFMGIKRMSYLIDPQGNIVKVYENVSPKTHASEVLSDVKLLMST